MSTDTGDVMPGDATTPAHVHVPIKFGFEEVVKLLKDEGVLELCAVDLSGRKDVTAWAPKVFLATPVSRRHMQVVSMMLHQQVNTFSVC